MGKRVLLIQLARLGDLVQTIPVITAFKEAHGDWTVDLLCPAQLEKIGRMIPGIAAVVPWDGAAWNQRARVAEREFHPDALVEADAAFRAIANDPYDCAFVLNQHPRAILAGALLARESIGAIVGGPLDQTLSPWATYVRAIASDRRENRIHLADAFCGMCGTSPPKRMRPMRVPVASLPDELNQIGQSEGCWTGLLVGAGEEDRLVPITVWACLIIACLNTLPRSRLVLFGSKQEQERAHAIQSLLPSSLLGRVWDTTGRLSLTELAQGLTRCQVVIGADTGPLHLAAALGINVIGWYFARARVHETGPYGLHHWVWQAEGEGESDSVSRSLRSKTWPIDETIAILANKPVPVPPNWSVWESHRDTWGAYYVPAGQEPTVPRQRESIWRELHPTPVG